MSERTWRLIIGLVVAAHGVGHLYFLIPALGVASWGQNLKASLLGSIAQGALVRPVGVLVWLPATAVWVLSGVGVLMGQAWWRETAVAGAALSLTGVGLFIGGLPLNPTINPVIFNLVTLVALLWLRWPSASLVGS